MAKLVKISELFDIRYGNSLELINLEQCKSTDVHSMPFVSRTSKNNGISAFVYEKWDIEPNPEHTLSVAVSGSVLSTFYQPKQYYTGFHVLVLQPRNPYSVIEMLFYARCISNNKYKYSYGRQANKTLKDILVPQNPSLALLTNLERYFNHLTSKLIEEALVEGKLDLALANWETFNIKDIFQLEKCKCPNASKLLNTGDDIFYIGAKKKNNGIMQKVEYEENLVSKGNAIVFIGDGQGSIGYATYQPIDFIGSTTLTCGYNSRLNPFNAMFIITLLDKERFKYSFGRKYGKTQLEKSTIQLPSKNGYPDFDFMERYTKTVKYSKAI